MARAHLMAVATALGLLMAVPVLADMPTIDAGAIAKAQEQLAELKKQITNQLKQLDELKQQVSFLNDINKLSNDISDAIGKVSHIALPIPNLEKMGAQTKGNLRCLLPDGVTAKWGIKTEDINLGSICETSDKYRSALFADPAAKGTTFSQQEAQRVKVMANRTALLEDVSSRSLAQADVQIKQADELNASADSLQSDLKAASTAQDRAHVNAQIAIAQVRGQAQQNQILAQLLKLQGAVAVMSGLPADKVAEITKDDGK